MSPSVGERYWTRRLAGAAAIMLAVLALNFLLFRIMPGDPVSSIVDPGFSPEAKEKLKELYGLDRPLWSQFLTYAKRTLTLDFGISFISRKPVWGEIASRLPNTIALMGIAVLGSAASGIWLGVKAATRKGGWTERLVLWGSALSFSFPSFFVQMVLLMALAYGLPLFPLRGSVSVPPPTEPIQILIDYLWHLVLPAGSLILLGFGGWALYARNLMVRVLEEDFILMAKARGLSEKRIIWRHAFRSILPPILTILLMSMPSLVSGAVITEAVFSLHGIGAFLLQSVVGHDYPAAGAAFYLLSLMTVGSNLLADAAYELVDPRVRLGRTIR